MKKFISHNLVLGVIASIALSGCSSINTTLREPIGTKVVAEDGQAMGATPLMIPVNCTLSGGQGFLGWAGVAGIGVLNHTAWGLILGMPFMFAPEFMGNTNIQLEMDSNSLTKAGFNKAEVDEILKTGNIIDVHFKNHGDGCGTNAKFEVTNEQLRSILLEGGEGTYSWTTANGSVAYKATMKKHNKY